MDKKYLILPVKNGAPKRNVETWVDGVKIRYFDIELVEDRPDWNAYLQIDQLIRNMRSGPLTERPLRRKTVGLA